LDAYPAGQFRRLKQLVPVTFTYASTSKSTTPNSTPQTTSADLTSTPICPSCSRELTNAVRSVLLTSKSPATAETVAEDAEPPTKKSKKEKEKEVATCGHVVCGQCADTIVKPGKQCVVCEARIRPDKDMIDLGREGELRSVRSGVLWICDSVPLVT
jgi:nitric oxide synthase-interacting protein